MTAIMLLCAVTRTIPTTLGFTVAVPAVVAAHIWCAIALGCAASFVTDERRAGARAVCA
jgi:hypothetical protein